ncbi:MAG: hypothetical protein OXM61_03875 [Candidatus Poribacteria bacterium]|nr:hypothetical protein [Candidatus Poribacteria bacterium]
MLDDIGKAAGEIWHYLEKWQRATYFMLDTASIADNGENAAE